MPRPWTLVERAETPDGILELRRRGDREFMIQHGGRVLMTSAYHRSEMALGALGCAPIARCRAHPRVLIGGAGLGFTLRAALDVLPKAASVTLAELNPVVLRWCRGPLAVLTGDAFGDRRTRAVVADVMDQVRSRTGPEAGWDAVVVDLYVGPGSGASEARHPLYGDDAVAAVKASLNPGGVYAVWGEEPSPPFERRLRRAGFTVRVERTRGPGPHHVIWLAALGRH